MKFSDRLKLAEEYATWIKENPIIQDCALSFATFLDIKGMLNSNVWIPTAERLPYAGEPVLFQQLFSENGFRLLIGKLRAKDMNFEADDEVIDQSEVVAWFPCPKYKEGD